MRILSFYVVTSLFAHGVVACGGQVSDVGNAATGGAFSGTGGAWASQLGTGGAINITTPTATGGTKTAYSVVATGGASVIHLTSASAGTAGYIAATGGAPYANTMLVNGFDSSAQVGAFLPSVYQPTDCLVNAALPNDAGAAASIEWSSSYDVNADAVNRGSMKVTVTFTNWNQFIDLAMHAPTDANGDPIDLTNKLVTAQVCIRTGLSPIASYPYGTVLYVKTGTNYVWGSSNWTNIETTSGWVTVKLDTTNPQGVPVEQSWNPRLPASLGFRLLTGGAGETSLCSMDYAVSFGPPQTTILYIDNIQIRQRP